MGCVTNLLLLGSILLLAGFSLSILGPFYPSHALTKGVSITQSGMVFASVFAAAVLVTPICGQYVNYWGPKVFLLTGACIIGFGNIVFGLLDQTNDALIFLSFSFAIRILIAVGEGTILASAYTIAAQQASKKHEGTLIAFAEACLGIGTTFGPLLGGFLYQLGGFPLPFWLCGGLILVAWLASIFLLMTEKSPYQTLREDEGKIGWWKLINTPGIPISIFSLTFAGTAWSWYTGTLELFLKDKFPSNSSETDMEDFYPYGRYHFHHHWHHHGHHHFHYHHRKRMFMPQQPHNSSDSDQDEIVELDSGEIGLVFMAFSLGYTIFTPLFGVLIDKGLNGLTTLLIGNLLIAISYIFVGPLPQLSFLGQHLWLTSLSVGLNGIGCSITYLGSLIYMMKCVTNTFPNNDQTRGMVSSLWVVSYSIGGYLGSEFGCLTYDEMGFESGTLVIMFAMIFAVVVLAVYKATTEYGCYKRNGLQKSILHQNDPDRFNLDTEDKTSSFKQAGPLKTKLYNLYYVIIYINNDYVRSVYVFLHYLMSKLLHNFM